MKRYGPIRKLMLIVLLSILGSYCIGSSEEQKNHNSFLHHVVHSTYGIVISTGSYVHKLWSEIMGSIQKVFNLNDNHSVVIQAIQDNVHGNNYYCTDGTNDCIYNEEFFNDTWDTGEVDLDPTTHLDIDSPSLELLPSTPR